MSMEDAKPMVRGYGERGTRAKERGRTTIIPEASGLLPCGSAGRKGVLSRELTCPMRVFGGGMHDQANAGSRIFYDWR